MAIKRDCAGLVALVLLWPGAAWSQSDGGSDLAGAIVEALTEAAAVIRERATGTVRIAGHTDTKGAEDYNRELSQQRANAVRDWFVNEGGLTEVGFVTEGFGETRPVAPNAKPNGSDDPEGRQKNRRVEIRIEK